MDGMFLAGKTHGPTVHMLGIIMACLTPLEKHHSTLHKYICILIYPTSILLDCSPSRTPQLLQGSVRVSLGTSSPGDISGRGRDISAFEDITGFSKIS